MNRSLLGLAIGILTTLPALAGGPRMVQPAGFSPPAPAPVLGGTHPGFNIGWGALNPQPLPPRVWTSPGASQPVPLPSTSASVPGVTQAALVPGSWGVPK